MDTLIQINSGLVQRGNDWIDIAYELYKIKQAIKELELMEISLSSKLKDMSHGVSSCGGNFMYKLSIRKGNVDYSIIPELKTVNLEKYRKSAQEIWKLEVKI